MQSTKTTDQADRWTQDEFEARIEELLNAARSTPVDRKHDARRASAINGSSIAMTDLNTTKLQEYLKSAGWRIDKKPMQDQMDKCDWYAWQPKCPDDWPDCECNDKPPSLVITPTVFDVPGSVTFSLRGQMGGQWYCLKMYSVPMDDAMQTIGKATSGLGAAWKVIAQMEKQT